MRDRQRPGDRRPNAVPRIPKWLVYFVVIAVTGLWMVGIVMSMLSKSFQMPESLNALMPLVLTVVLGSKHLSDQRRNGRDDDDE